LKLEGYIIKKRKEVHQYMDNQEFTLEPLIREFIHDEAIISNFRSAFAKPISSKKKLQLIDQIVRTTGRNIDPVEYYAYKEWLQMLIDKIIKFEVLEPENNAYFSHHDNIREVVISSLHSAKNDLKICMYTISDNPIADSILQCFSRGVNVRIITDDGKILDKGSDIISLDERGIDIRIDSDKSLMHHKFVIVDNVKILTGSYNWTRTGSDINNENILVTTNKKIAKAYKKEFKRLWKEMKPLPH